MRQITRTSIAGWAGFPGLAGVPWAESFTGISLISGYQAAEILHEAQGKGERKYHVKWRDTIVLRKHLAMFEKEGYKTESQRPLAEEEYISLTDREQRRVASWKPTYEPADSIGNSEQIQQLLAEMRAKLKPSQQELGPARRDDDLTDDRQIQGN